MSKFLHVLLICIVCSLRCYAAEWTLTGTLNPVAEYNDNVFLSADPESTVHYSVTPTVAVTRALENSELSLAAGYQIDRYSNLSSDNDTDNPFVTMKGSFSTERSSYGITANYSETTSRSSALEDTGDFETQSIVRTRTLSPSYRYQLTERDSLLLNGSYSERLYSTSDFSDNQSKSLSVGWQRKFSERLSSSINLNFSNYQADGILTSADDDNYALSSSFTYKWSELWDITGNIGIRRLDSEQVSLSTGQITKSRSSGSSFGILAVRNDEVNSYTIDVSRSLYPSSTGDVNENDKIAMSWSHKITENLTTNLGLSYLESASAVNDSKQKRENINFTSSLSWQFERNLGLSFAYSYRQQSVTGIKTVDSNLLSIKLTYNWDGIRRSR